MTVASMLVAVAVVGAGLFIVGFGDGSRERLVAGGVIVGVGRGRHALPGHGGDDR